MREEGGTADAFVLHSCAVTGAAQNEALRRLRAAKRAGIPEIVVSGCVANVADEAELREAGATAVVSRRAPVASGLGALVGAALRGAVPPEGFLRRGRGGAKQGG